VRVKIAPNAARLLLRDESKQGFPPRKTTVTRVCALAGNIPWFRAPGELTCGTCLLITSENSQSIFEHIFSPFSTDYSAGLLQLLSKKSQHHVLNVLGKAVPTHATGDFRALQPRDDHMVENSMSLLVVLSTTKNRPIPIVTLHDVLRLQNQLSDAASL